MKIHQELFLGNPPVRQNEKLQAPPLSPSRKKQMLAVLTQNHKVSKIKQERTN